MYGFVLQKCNYSYLYTEKKPRNIHQNVNYGYLQVAGYRLIHFFSKYLPTTYVLSQRLANFFVRDQTVNILGFAAHTVCSNYSVLPLQHKSSYRQYGDECTWLCLNKTLLIKKKGNRPDLACGPQVANSCTNHCVVYCSNLLHNRHHSSNIERGKKKF